MSRPQGRRPAGHPRELQPGDDHDRPGVRRRTYVEPITPEFVEKVIAKERPDAILPTLGGQTALNTATALHENGVLEKYGVEMIGASFDAIHRGENREKFNAIVAKVGGEVARSFVCHTMAEVEKATERSATRSSSAPPSPWAASAPASPTTRPTCTASLAPVWPRRRPPRC